MGDFFSQEQIQSQKQTQIMSQAQTYSLKVLSMDTDDLRDEILKTVNENPFLILEDGFSKKDFSKKSHATSGYANQKASDAYQAILEQKTDERKILSEHLLTQLHTERLSNSEMALGEKLIYNLDKQGHHHLEPATLLDKNNPKENLTVLEKLISLIQNFDPVGCCTKNFQESLLVQARANPKSSDLTIFILDGHLDFINPPKTERAEKKIREYLDKRKKMFGLSEKESSYLNLDFDTSDVEESIDFIKNLNPFPAANFYSDETHFVSPDIYIEEISAENLDADSDNEKILRAKNILKINNRFWKINIRNSGIPKINLDKEIESIKNSNADLDKKIKAAQEFLQTLENRKSTMEKSAWEIVKVQHEFFEKGPGYLKPYRLKDLAASLSLSESTISRVANGKYLDFNGSLYPLKYFFDYSVSSNKNDYEDLDDKNQNLSRDNVLMEIEKILEEHKDDKKKISDQKISDILGERGIKIARRTVAKYRDKLNVASSYDR